ncbi:MAG: hypothetical protein V1705_02745, partial [bacterium]
RPKPKGFHFCSLSLISNSKMYVLAEPEGSVQTSWGVKETGSLSQGESGVGADTAVAFGDKLKNNMPAIESAKKI